MTTENTARISKMQSAYSLKAESMVDQGSLTRRIFGSIKRRTNLFTQKLRLAKYIFLAIANPQLTRNYAYDLARFLKYSAIDKRTEKQNQDNLSAWITMDYHAIEKGLALKHPKPLFGFERIERLMKNAQKYQQKYGTDDLVWITINSLEAYSNFNLGLGIQNEKLAQGIESLKQQIAQSQAEKNAGGVVSVDRETIHRHGKLDLTNFFASRYSVRQFTEEDVSLELIEQAVAMAQKTPSVCNRQSAKVYVFSKEEDKKKVLSYQNGNRGFGEQASKVLIVTSTIGSFVSVGERNQSWIDGGMFSMSLVYALHSLGLGSCCLNWSVDYEKDQAMRQAAGIGDDEAVMMMIAVGHLPETFRVAQSPRRNLNEVLIIKQS